MSVYNDRLQIPGQRAPQLMADSEELDESTWDLAYLTVLAALFDYEVNNGGFGQLLFNVGNQGEEGLLEQLDGMLRTVNAPVGVVLLCTRTPYTGLGLPAQARGPRKSGDSPTAHDLP